jgi:hypothetical protein
MIFFHIAVRVFKKKNENKVIPIYARMVNIPFLSEFAKMNSPKRIMIAFLNGNLGAK